MKGQDSLGSDEERHSEIKRRGLSSLWRKYSGLSSKKVIDDEHDTRERRSSLSRSPSRPRLLERGESSKVNLGDVYRTLQRHGGRINIEQEFPRLDHDAPSYLKRKRSSTHTSAETQTHFPMGSTRAIDEVPIGAIYATIALSWNSVLMLIAEAIIEVLILVGLFPKLPLRTAFLFLTLLSGVLGAQTLVAVRRKEFDTSHNALQVGLIVELALIIGDLEFLLSKYRTKYPAALPTRAPFMVLTAINVILIGFLYTRLRLYEKRTSHALPELVRPVELGIGSVTEFARALLPPVSRMSASTWTLDDLGVAVVRHVETVERQQLHSLSDEPSPPPSPPAARLSCTAAGNNIISLCPEHTQASPAIEDHLLAVQEEDSCADEDGKEAHSPDSNV